MLADVGGDGIYLGLAVLSIVVQPHETVIDGVKDHCVKMGRFAMGSQSLEENRRLPLPKCSDDSQLSELRKMMKFLAEFNDELRILGL